MTSQNPQKNFKYLPFVEHDLGWGLVVSCVGHHHIAPGEVYPPSQHPASHSFLPSDGRILDEYQLIFYTRGQGTFRSDMYSETRIKEGDLIMLFPGERHTYFPDEDTGWDEYWIGFRGPSIASRVEHGFFTPEIPVYHIMPDAQAQIVGLFLKAIDVAHGMGKGYQQMLAGYVELLLGIIAFSNPQASGPDMHETEDIHRAMLYIHKNYKGNIHPEDVSRHIGWGYSHFRKVFQQQTGTSPYQYILEMRIKQSKHLLLNTRMPLKEIAYEMGFSNPDYFTTAFRRVVGIPPLAFRKQNG